LLTLLQTTVACTEFMEYARS